MRPQDYLNNIPTELLDIPEGRRELCRYNPMLFALIYMPHHLMDADGNITFSEFGEKIYFQQAGKFI